MSEFACVRNGWSLLVSSVPERTLKTLVTFFVHELFFWGSFLPFLLADRLRYFDRWRLQPDKVAGPPVVTACFLRVALNHLCLVLPIIIVTHPVYDLLGSSHTVSTLPTLSTMLLQLAFFFVAEDIAFYWGHRALHTPWLYKNIHAVHHEHAAPFGIAAEYAHPAEVLFLGFATFIGPFLVGPHLLTLYAWLALRCMQTVECHSGYDFPWSVNRWFPLYGGAEFHDHHHRTFSGNYASTFIWVDWLMGTDKAYRGWREGRATGKVEGKAE